MIDIVIEVDEMIRTGNVSATFAPVQDEEYLSGSTRFLGESPKSALERGNFKKVAFLAEQDLVRSGSLKLAHCRYQWSLA